MKRPQDGPARTRAIRNLKIIAAPFILGLAYLLLWPVPVDPMGWDAPKNPGYAGSYAENTRLAEGERLALAGQEGPEDAAVGVDGAVFVSTRGGSILRYPPGSDTPEVFVDTGGAPLGLELDGEGRLLVADAYKGLLRVENDKQIKVLAAEADGVPIRYADAVAVAKDGKIYFTDASTKFGAQVHGGSYAASLLDIMEHGGHGRLLEYDPITERTTTVASGLQFANGVALTPDGAALVVETGSYRVVRVGLRGAEFGLVTPVLENLPGFPDNIRKGRDGRYWVGLVSPRSGLLDAMSGLPFVRKVAQRLPAFLRPKAGHYGHVLAIDARGKVLISLQDPAGDYAFVTGAVETETHVYVTSLKATTLARLPRAGLGL